MPVAIASNSRYLSCTETEIHVFFFLPSRPQLQFFQKAEPIVTIQIPTLLEYLFSVCWVFLGFVFLFFSRNQTLLNWCVSGAVKCFSSHSPLVKQHFHSWLIFKYSKDQDIYIQGSTYSCRHVRQKSEILLFPTFPLSLLIADGLILNSFSKVPSNSNYSMIQWISWTMIQWK